MSVHTLTQFLLYSMLLNYGLVTLWFLAFHFARGRIYALHSRWFSIKREQFDGIHYLGMAIYKIGIMLFNLVPYIALRLVS
ncbi:DUF6868 family protein [Methylomonas sp.]|jgi:hypothetical protein|uniref:DUF6868 family protein n=1 Tax=Methylomonas sp. TaxID=418 RepID=UPI003428CF76